MKSRRRGKWRAGPRWSTKTAAAEDIVLFNGDSKCLVSSRDNIKKDKLEVDVGGVVAGQTGRAVADLEVVPVADAALYCLKSLFATRPACPLPE